MKKEKTEQTAIQIKLAELIEQKYLTVEGKMTIPQMVAKFGLPKAILKYAKIEARTGMCQKPTVVVDRFIDGELFFNKQVVVGGISKQLILLMDCNGIEVEYIRHPTYNPANMVKASDKEINSLIEQQVK